jgi:alpha-glucosidase
MLYRRLIELRRQRAGLSVGAYLPLQAPAELLAYLRSFGEERYLVVLNLGHRSHLFMSAEAVGEVVVGTDRAREGERVDGRVALMGDDGLVIQLNRL